MSDPETKLDISSVLADLSDQCPSAFGVNFEPCTAPLDAVVTTVALFGASRTGKTTARDVLLNGATHYAPMMSIFSGTIMPHDQTYRMDDGRYIRFIDVPGLFERTKIDGEPRSDDKLLEITRAALEGITINRAFLCFSVTGGIDSSAINAMKFYRELATELDFFNRTSILITRAEEMDEPYMKDIIGQLHRHQRVGKIMRALRNRVFFSGAIAKGIHFHGCVQTVMVRVNRINAMRERLLTFIMAVSRPTQPAGTGAGAGAGAGDQNS
jgi:hypothetical protein